MNLNQQKNLIEMAAQTIFSMNLERFWTQVAIAALFSLLERTCGKRELSLLEMVQL